MRTGIIETGRRRNLLRLANRWLRLARTMLTTAVIDKGRVAKYRAEQLAEAMADIHEGQESQEDIP